MTNRDEEILDQWARDVLPQLQSLSKSFGPSIRYGIGNDALLIDGHPQIGVLVYGRGPTTFGASRGEPPLRERILDWIQSKGIQPRSDNETPMSQESLAFLITRSIHRNGTRLYQEIKRGAQPRDIFGDIITEDRVNNLLKLLSDEYEQKIVSDVLLKTFKQ
jgi:hypothetical protein